MSVDTLNIGRWKINLMIGGIKRMGIVMYRTFTLFRIGMILSPLSFATWKTEMVWAWMPWEASTSNKAPWHAARLLG